MARGVSIGDVTNILDSSNIMGEEKLPVSSGETEPQVVTTGELKEYITDGLPTEGRLTEDDIDRIINNLRSIIG